MRRRTRHAWLIPVAAAVALGAAAPALAASATAAPVAVAAGTCTVSPMANGKYYVQGKGFSGVISISNGKAAFTVTADKPYGTFSVRNTKSSTYTVTPVAGGPTVTCTASATAQPTPKETRKQYEQGYQAGYTAGRAAGCARTTPPAGSSEYFTKGYQDGSSAARERSDPPCPPAGAPAAP
ncbi:hypothetical protein AB0M92_04435 [Streptomyces sp. NPDC051582]|uniref:hypothetical protein n=1 Tax=Streptomyces sp. NPDC051582 TaxID=3155167 RepID=UPI00342828CE